MYSPAVWAPNLHVRFILFTVETKYRGLSWITSNLPLRWVYFVNLWAHTKIPPIHFNELRAAHRFANQNGYHSQLQSEKEIYRKKYGKNKIDSKIKKRFLITDKTMFHERQIEMQEWDRQAPDNVICCAHLCWIVLLMSISCEIEYGSITINYKNKIVISSISPLAHFINSNIRMGLKSKICHYYSGFSFFLSSISSLFRDFFIPKCMHDC